MGEKDEKIKMESPIENCAVLQNQSSQVIDMGFQRFDLNHSSPLCGSGERATAQFRKCPCQKRQLPIPGG